MNEKTSIPSEVIEKRIFIIRGQKVILDFHIAELYQVETKALKRAVKRNKDRFPSDFCFELTTEEFQHLRYQIGTSKWGGVRYSPYAFTEQGVAMLSGVLQSKRSIQVNIEIMRAFVKLREMLASHKDLARKLEELEKKYDSQFQVVFNAIRQILTPPEKPKRGIGFHVNEPIARYNTRKNRKI
jgi:phage regulator Rha-like protein